MMRAWASRAREHHCAGSDRRTMPVMPHTLPNNRMESITTTGFSPVASPISLGSRTSLAKMVLTNGMAKARIDDQKPKEGRVEYKQWHWQQHRAQATDIRDEV